MSTEPIRKRIFVRKDVILSRIGMQINLVARARGNNGVPDSTLNVVEQYEDMLVELINKYYSKAESRMAAYIEKEKRYSQMDYPKDWEERTIYLTMPYYWKEETFENLASSINDYIVNAVVAEYFALIYTSKDPLTVDRLNLADEAFADIKHYCLTSKPHSIKKKLHPF